jgi:[protein-PII] uridylyltransferase
MQEFINDLRVRLTTGQTALTAQWRSTRDSRAILSARAELVDGVLRDLWAAHEFPDDYALVAVGGYGRGELYPGSDVDLLILLPDEQDGASAPRLERFIGVLWDVGLDIGHSVRTRAECLEEAESDITVKTALLESRLLTGALWAYEDFEQSFRDVLNPVAFLKAKRLEQAERYARYYDTPFALEPNCKESPGGLRDLQIIYWVARAANLGDNWKALATANLISTTEARHLERAETRLRDLRTDLHLLTGRREERLLFDYQEKLAKAMSLEATPSRRASEVLMQQYYLNAKRITQLNTLLLETFAERLQPSQHGVAIIIDEHFQTVRDRLDVRDVDIFERKPETILKCCLLQMQRTELKGMTPRTLRALWHARNRINAEFRHKPENRDLFISLFKQKHLIRVIRRMNQYDILGRYIPAFGRIVGQMQHDLFHVYTVDQHILQVMRNLRRFCMPEFAHEYPFCSRLMTGFDKPWLLYLAALFHDIAKGRGGDHSKLGVADARRFCTEHEFAEDDSDLIAFLVGQHLTMSAVAQKQDLSDPDVIARFAGIVGNLRNLTALYLLTVADIRGTSPKVWNAWKGKLLEDLFRITARLLRGESATQLMGINERQEEARRLLRYHGLRSDVELALWEQLDTSYFMRHDAEEIAWHTRTLYYRAHSEAPVIRARLNAKAEGIQVMVYAPDQAFFFARLCGFYARKGFSIVDAKIHTTRHGYALDSFVILDSTGKQPYRDMVALIEHDLTEQIGKSDALIPAPTGRLSRQVKHFPISPEVDIRADERGNQFLMSISAADRPGLLFSVATVLAQHNIQLHSAKIATLGERIEDVFLISGKELSQTATLVKIEQELLSVLQV